MYTLKTLSVLYLQALQRFCFFSTVKVGNIPQWKRFFNGKSAFCLYDSCSVFFFCLNDDGRDIFTSSKARKMVAEAIYKEVLKGLKKESFKIEF